MRVSRLQDLGLLRVWGAVSRPPDTCAEYVCKAGSKETVCIQIYINIYVYIYIYIEGSPLALVTVYLALSTHFTKRQDLQPL